MKEYFYTNVQLLNVLDNGDGAIDWVGNGFNIKDVRQNQIQFFENNKTVSVLPIFDKTLFNKSLGDLIIQGEAGGIFYKVIQEEEYKNILEHKKELDEKNTIANYNASKKTFEENQDFKSKVEELENVTTELMLENLQLKGVIQ